MKLVNLLYSLIITLFSVFWVTALVWLCSWAYVWAERIISGY